MDSSMNVQPQASEGCPGMAEPVEQHAWLQQLIGDWTIESEMIMDPSQPPVSSTGRESVRALGKLWTIGDMSGLMPGGGEMESIITLGYDSTKQRFVGSFVAGVSDFMWRYEGELSSDGKTLTLSCVGPNMAPGAEPGSEANYQDIVEIVDADHRVLRSRAEGTDGEWFEFMTARFTRVK